MREDDLRIVIGMHELADAARQLVSRAEGVVQVEGISEAMEHWGRILSQGFEDRTQRWAAIGKPAPGCRLELLESPLPEPNAHARAGLSGWPVSVELQARTAGLEPSAIRFRGPVLIVDNESALIVTTAGHELEVPSDGACELLMAGYVVKGRAAAGLSIQFARRWRKAGATDGLQRDMSAARSNPRFGRGIEDAQRSIRMFVSRHEAPSSPRRRIGASSQVSEVFC